MIAKVVKNTPANAVSPNTGHDGRSSVGNKTMVLPTEGGFGMSAAWLVR